MGAMRAPLPFPACAMLALKETALNLGHWGGNAAALRTLYFCPTQALYFKLYNVRYVNYFTFLSRISRLYVQDHF